MVHIHPGTVNAVLTHLGEEANRAVYNVGVDDVTAEQMRLSGTPVLPLGAPVSIFMDPHLWLGEVEECGPGSALPGSVMVIKLVHSLADVKQLTLLAERFLGKQLTPAPTLS